MGIRRDPIRKAVLIQRIYAMLEEDVGFSDITTNALVSNTQNARAKILTRQPCVVAGVELIAAFLEDLGIEISPRLSDGAHVKSNAVLIEAMGSAKTFLTVERTILNLLSRMCAIATLTASMVAAAKGGNPKIRVAATRKTAPFLRVFDKLAVVAGGGDPHRWRLDAAVLIKDNHLALMKDIKQAVSTVREKVSFITPIEIEVSLRDDAIIAAQAGVDAILLDNMVPQQISETVKAIRKLKLSQSPVLEVSGNITLGNIAEYASTGVDIISVGSLTHSVTAIDLTLDLEPI